MTTRRTVATLFVLVVAATVGTFGAAGPASGAATGVSGATVTPSTVSTGEAAAVSVSMTVDGVDTSDATTGGSVTLSFPDAADLVEARATNVAVGPTVDRSHVTYGSGEKNGLTACGKSTGGIDCTGPPTTAPRAPSGCLSRYAWTTMPPSESPPRIGPWTSR